jgi:hypothetical protein
MLSSTSSATMSLFGQSRWTIGAWDAETDTQPKALWRSNVALPRYEATARLIKRIPPCWQNDTTWPVRQSFSKT